jgi:histidyl-tRNA synthetase
MAGPIEARCFKGTEDIMPEKMIPRQKMLRIITGVFESYGFAPLETPAMEFMDVLLAKSGEENAKLIYNLAYKGGQVLGLRFDLTVPLARLVAMRPDLPLPFKRYQIQPVWRGERAQIGQGRFREFYQCDVDTIGSSSIVADAENVACSIEVYEKLGITRASAGLVARVNHRKILRAIVVAAGLPAEMDGAVCTILDKADKIERSEIEKLLLAAGVDAAAQARLFDLIAIGERAGKTSHEAILAELERRFAGIEVGLLGLVEMRELFTATAALGVPRELVEFDLVLTRGMDYYTGPIYEFRATTLTSFGSLGGGGRYDDLIGIYCGRDVPATGVSVGLSRVQEALEALGLAEAKRSSPTRALVIRFDDVALEAQLGLVRALRARGVPAEIYLEGGRFKKQMLYADRKGIPFAVIQGSTEVEKGTAQVKELATGKQEEMPVERLADFIGA